MRAARVALHPGDAHSTGTTGPERHSMPLPSLDVLVCLKLTCASSTRAVQLEVDVYVPELRSGRDLRVVLAGFGRLVGPMAEKL